MSGQLGRPRLQFGLRTLLMVMLGVALFFAGRISRQGEVERTRQAALEARQAAEAAHAAQERAARAAIEASYWSALESQALFDDDSPGLRELTSQLPNVESPKDEAPATAGESASDAAHGQKPEGGE